MFYIERSTWPNWRLIVTTETTQIVGTLAAVYGWGMTPLGWKYALGVWVYALVWFFINDMVKVEVHHLLNLGTARHQRHLARVNARLHPASSKASDAVRLSAALGLIQFCWKEALRGSVSKSATKASVEIYDSRSPNRLPSRAQLACCSPSGSRVVFSKALNMARASI